MQESWSDLAKQLWWEMNPQNNYHGTPYTFNRFDDSKWLTGEGFQAHGPGHYSADWFNTAEKYKKPNISVKRGNNLIDRDLLSPNYVSRFLDNYRNYPDIFNESSKREIDRLVREIDKYTDEYNNGIKAYGKHIERLQSRLDFLNNIDQYKVVESPGNLYRVTVPNENFMWKEGLPLESQSEYVQKSVINRKPIDYTKYLSRYPDHTAHIISKLNDSNLKRLADLFYQKGDYIQFLNKKNLDLASRMINKLPIDEQMSFLKYLNDGDTNTAQDMIKLYGDDVKGIRAIGRQDGPINVVFSDRNIRMSNTPFQRFTNRIPTQTLGKMAEKIMSSPVVKVGGQIIEKSATPLMVYDMLKLQGYDPRLYFGSQKEKEKALQEYGKGLLEW